MIRLIVTAILVFFIARTASAEYRVFELLLTDSTTGQESTVLSNLDPNQYRQYYPVKAGVIVQYRNTWMCPGNTSHQQPYCSNPKAQN